MAPHHQEDLLRLLIIVVSKCRLLADPCTIITTWDHLHRLVYGTLPIRPTLDQSANTLIPNTHHQELGRITLHTNHQS